MIFTVLNAKGEYTGILNTDRKPHVYVKGGIVTNPNLIKLITGRRLVRKS